MVRTMRHGCVACVLVVAAAARSIVSDDSWIEDELGHASTADPTCNAQGWCQSPEASYPQQCSEDAGPVWGDDGESFPNKHYWSGSPAKPILPASGTCPPPLAAACTRKGTKAAYMDGPIKCGGKGFFCRIVPQPGWLNPNPQPMKGDPQSQKGIFREANFYHCNKTTTGMDMNDMYHWDSGHCHGGIADDVYGWFMRDHWFRGYAGTLHCCCDYGATQGVVNSCDVRRPVTAEEAKVGCNDPNEDARAQHMYRGGCSAAQKASFKDPLHSAAPGHETCWTITSFSDPAQTAGYKGADEAGGKGVTPDPKPDQEPEPEPEPEQASGDEEGEEAGSNEDEYSEAE